MTSSTGMLAVGRDRQHLLDAVVHLDALRDVERRRGDLGAQRLDAPSCGRSPSRSRRPSSLGALRRMPARAPARCPSGHLPGCPPLPPAARVPLLRRPCACPRGARRGPRPWASGPCPRAPAALAAGADLLGPFLPLLAPARRLACCPSCIRRAPVRAGRACLRGRCPPPRARRGCGRPPRSPWRRARRCAVFDEAADEGVERGCLGARRRGRPVRVERVDAEHARSSRRPGRAARAASCRSPASSAGVAGAHGVVQHGERLRHAEVVVHRRGERVGDRRDADAGVARACERALDALEEARMRSSAASASTSDVGA